MISPKVRLPLNASQKERIFHLRQFPLPCCTFLVFLQTFQLTLKENRLKSAGQADLQKCDVR